MDILSTLFLQPSRKIGLLVPDVVISEKHQDQLEITEHPVEIGAEIADHAYKRPAELTMEVGFAGGGSLLDLWDTAKIGLSLGLSPRETYQRLLELQASRQPFEVITVGWQAFLDSQGERWISRKTFTGAAYSDFTDSGLIAKK